MDTCEFLKRVVPDGHMCIADHVQIEDKKVFIHYVFGNHANAAAFATQLDKQGHTIYFALASFKETFKTPTDKLRIKRTAKNVSHLKALWIDVDNKDCPNGSAVGAIKKYLLATKMPRPSLMVKSGNGIHLYWPLVEAIPVEEWLPLAEGLKADCVAHNFPCDGVCTSDSARVLRPPGTHNRKNPDSPQPVILAWETEEDFDPVALAKCLPQQKFSAIPAHLRGKAVTNEYSANQHRRTVDTKQVIGTCAVLRHIMITGGAEQSEPEWNSTLLFLKYLDGGAKLVHPMSSRHIDYDYDATQEKWEQKLAAGTTGPTKCSTFEGWHPTLCQGCPKYKSKKSKTPMAMGYVDPTPQQAEAPKTGTPVPKLGAVQSLTTDYPYGWRAMQGNEGVERKVFDKESKEWVYEKVLKRTWRLLQAQKSANTDEYTYVLQARARSGKAITIEVQGTDLWGSSKTWETLSARGVPLTTNEQSHWKDLMATWLQKLQEENAVLDTTDQLGWIERTEDGNKEITGFASGGAAFFSDGSTKNSVVTANHKHKGIAEYYTPVGSIEKWKNVAEFLNAQGHDHILAMLVSAFAGPLVKFTGQSGVILSIVSTGTSAGKSISLETAAAVWGNPKLGTMTLQDTPTTIKNKVAYLQNLTAYWDEVRGDERNLHDFIQTAFQITQGKDRERADRSARTIAAQTWHTMLVCTSNDSVFDLAAQETGASDAGVYRIFELNIPNNEKPQRDPRVATMVAELQNNYGVVGEAYAKYLAANAKQVRAEVEKWTVKMDNHFKAQPAERFWVATIATLMCGAAFASKAGLMDVDMPSLFKYLSKVFNQLRSRVIGSKNATDPKELLVAYQMQHQHERLVVENLRLSAGGKYEPVIVGNHSHLRKLTYQIGQQQGLMRVAKGDFKRWLQKTRSLNMSGDLEQRFKSDTNMTESRATLGAGTSWATSRALCLDFNIDIEDVDDDE